MSGDLEQGAQIYHDQLLRAREIIIKYKSLRDQIRLIDDHIAYLDQLAGELYAITNTKDEA